MRRSGTGISANGFGVDKVEKESAEQLFTYFGELFYCVGNLNNATHFVSLIGHRPRSLFGYPPASQKDTRSV